MTKQAWWKVKKEKKKIIKTNTDKLMSPLALLKAKRTSEEDGRGLPSKKRVVSLYDQATRLTMVDAIKQPRQ